jgi:hypothetical protein
MEKSKGHIMFLGDREMYLDGWEIFIAPTSSVLDVSTGNRIGRWEGSASHIIRFAGIYGKAAGEMAALIERVANES